MERLLSQPNNVKPKVKAKNGSNRLEGPFSITFIACPLIRAIFGSEQQRYRGNFFGVTKGSADSSFSAASALSRTCGLCHDVSMPRVVMSGST